MNSISSEEFFKLLASNAGVDLDTAKRTYYGMVRTITRQLRGGRRIKLPDFCEISIRIYKEREIIDINTKKRKKVEPTPTIKFDADYKVKKYFRDLRINGTML